MKQTATTKNKIKLNVNNNNNNNDKKKGKKDLEKERDVEQREKKAQKYWLKSATVPDPFSWNGLKQQLTLVDTFCQACTHVKRREPDNNYAIPISFLRSFICCHSRPFFFFFFRRSPVRPFLLLFLSFSLLVSTLSRFSFVAFLRIVPRKIHGDSLARTRQREERRNYETEEGEIAKEQTQETGNDRYRFRGFEPPSRQFARFAIKRNEN